MSGRYIIASETEQVVEDWGRLRWLSNPEATGAEKLTVIEVELAPGKGHDFHKHPAQEEVIYVVAGRVEQWVGEMKRELSAGDSVFIPANTVHASFNVGEGNARVIAILGPCAGPIGYEIVDVASTEPWSTMRR
jgi:quercetin dioxygenase-like cupin family protein